MPLKPDYPLAYYHKLLHVPYSKSIPVPSGLRCSDQAKAAYNDSTSARTGNLLHGKLTQRIFPFISSVLSWIFLELLVYELSCAILKRWDLYTSELPYLTIEVCCIHVFTQIIHNVHFSILLEQWHNKQPTIYHFQLKRLLTCSSYRLDLL